ncbi:2Fe-2S iron-sulfur cluster binding domain-containing protein [Variovorax paradoxus]|uniref:2Fe-2S iron-sulfur cluster binding domain-containing protein n=1 Tax=Variovorax paradoxus TaxID=34073 RepID=UPI00399289A8
MHASPINQEKNMPFSIAIANTSEQYDCQPDQTLLGGMEKLGRKGIPVGCRGGGCGVCKVRIESGHVRHDRMSRCHVSAAEEAQGYVLACRAYPQSDLALRAVDKLARCIERHAATASRNSSSPT